MYRPECYFYHLQTKLGERSMFSQECVKNNDHVGCVCVSQHALGGGWQTSPLADTPIQATPWADTPCQTPTHWPAFPMMATAAGSMHPTGMHSCSVLCQVCLLPQQTNHRVSRHKLSFQKFIVKTNKIVGLALQSLYS